MYNQLLNNLKIGIYNVVKELGYLGGNITQIEDVYLETPKDKEHGDYATNIAMQLAKNARKKPQEIANEIIAKLDYQQMHISNVEIAGPGFINLTLDLNYLCNIFFLINEKGTSYGQSQYGQGKKVNLEFVSANPTGYLHIGHGRGAAYGDSLAKIMRKAGYFVETEHYVNDAGNQITNMAHSIYQRYLELHNLPSEMKDDYYYGKEIILIAEKLKQEAGDYYINNFDLTFFRKFGTEKLLNNLKKDLHTFNVQFDNWFSEQSLYDTKMVEQTLQKLIDNGYTYKNEGALWLKTTLYGDEKDRVIVKSDGNFTYLLPDIAYHYNKLKRGYHLLIDVFGADHHGHIDPLKSAITMIGGNSELIEIEILQMVRVIENGQEVKMSKRSGKAITLIDLIEEVGSDVLRYFYVSKSLSTHMDLDLNLMKQKSNDNPVFYAQYAHARICNIFKNFQNNHEIIFVKQFKKLNLKSVKAIALTLLQYPGVIQEVVEKRLVHKLTHYISDLSYLLHSYYNDEKVITNDLELTNEKLTILLAIKTVLADALTLIGVSAPEKM